jgi:hypothetical protein
MGDISSSLAESESGVAQTCRYAREVTAQIQNELQELPDREVQRRCEAGGIRDTMKVGRNPVDAVASQEGDSSNDPARRGE